MTLVDIMNPAKTEIVGSPESIFLGRGMYLHFWNYEVPNGVGHSVIIKSTAPRAKTQNEQKDILARVNTTNFGKCIKFDENTQKKLFLKIDKPVFNEKQQEGVRNFDLVATVVSKKITKYKKSIGCIPLEAADIEAKKYQQELYKKFGYDVDITVDVRSDGEYYSKKDIDCSLINYVSNEYSVCS